MILSEKLTFFEGVTSCLRSFKTFGGRSRRAEFWWFYLFICIGGFVLIVADVLLQTGSRMFGNSGTFPLSVGFAYFAMLPLSGCAWRRMHDLGKPGAHSLPFLIVVSPVFSLVLEAIGALSTIYGPLFFIALALILMGFLYSLHLLMVDGVELENAYGPSPKYSFVSRFRAYRP